MSLGLVAVYAGPSVHSWHAYPGPEGEGVFFCLFVFIFSFLNCNDFLPLVPHTKTPMVVILPQTIKAFIIRDNTFIREVFLEEVPASVPVPFSQKAP